MLPQYIPPPIFQVPHGTSLGGTVVPAIGETVANALTAWDQDRQRKEDHDLFIQKALNEIALKEAVTPIQGERPTIPQGEVNQIPSRPVTGVDETMRIGAPVSVPMTGPAPSDESVTVPGIKYKGQTIIPDRRVKRTYTDDQPKKDSEILTQEAWNELPAFYKGRWKPGQRVSTEAVGSVGMQIMHDAAEKARNQTMLDREDIRANSKLPQAPASRHVAGRVQEWQTDTGTWKDVGPVEDPSKVKAEKAPKMQWVTRTSDGKRVKISDDEAASAPAGTYTDVKPVVPKSDAGDLKKYRDSALAVLGGPNDKPDSDTLWSLAQRTTVPGPVSIAGPVGKAVGVAASAANMVGMAPDVDLYNSQLKGYAAILARATGHNGRITNFDQQRVIELFPKIGEPQRTANRKLNRIRDIISGKEPVPDTFWDPQPGVWPPPGGVSPSPAPASGGKNGAITPEEDAILQKHGF